MTDLEGLIRFWERILFDFRFLMEPSTRSYIEFTIKLLRELKTKKEVSK